MKMFNFSLIYTQKLNFLKKNKNLIFSKIFTNFLIFYYSLFCFLPLAIFFLFCHVKFKFSTFVLMVKFFCYVKFLL